ncbi:MAG: alpha/beta hydrolase [Chlamydiia bacterium]|nr:alpha/beta hydrolase [Chlamydiia bacterium]
MKTFHSKEGKICYTAQGEGSSAFLLVHNSGGSHEMMDYSAAHFSKRGKVIVPDLLGHAASDSPKVEYTLNLFADSMIQLCKYENLSRVIFIGLNYGADIGIEIAKMAPSLISHLILIEPPIFMEPWIVKVVEQQIKDLANPREEWAQETVNSVILKAPDYEREISLKALKLTPAFVKASTFKHLLTWDKKHSFSCSLPTLMIQASQPFCTEEKARTVFSNLQVGRVVGSGPWVNLEVPIQAHSMIDRFLEIY